MKKINDITELPLDLRDELSGLLVDDILERYANNEYYDPQITEDFLKEHGYELRAE